MNTSIINENNNQEHVDPSGNYSKETLLRDGETNDTTEEVVRKVISSLSFYQEDPRNFVNGLCAKIDPEFDLSTARSVIHALIRCVIYTNYNYINESYNEQRNNPDIPNPSKELITSFSRIYGVRTFYKSDGTKEYKPDYCRRKDKCPYCIGNAIFIWISKRYSNYFYLADGYERLSGCGYYHDDSQVDEIRSKVYKTLDEIYNEDMCSTSQNYYTRPWSAMINIRLYLCNYKWQNLQTETIKYFKLNNLSREQIMDKTNRSRVRNLSMPVIRDEDIFMDNSYPIASEHQKNNTVLAQLANFDISNNDLFPGLEDVMKNNPAYVEMNELENEEMEMEKNKKRLKGIQKPVF